MVDGKPAGGLLPKSARHTSISKLQPGQHASVSLVAVASDGQPVDMSNSVKVRYWSQSVVILSNNFVKIEC
jgi:hypothetical protein